MKKYKIKSNAVDLQIYESRNSQDNVTLLFLHGGPGSGAWPLILQEAIQTLMKTYHCVFFDQRGCGLSLFDLHEGIDFHDMLHDIQSVALDIRKQHPRTMLILCGESFGGTLAMQCVDIFPDLFDGLILSSAFIMRRREDALSLFTLLKQRYREHASVRVQKIISILDSASPEEFFHNSQIHQLIEQDTHATMPLKHVMAMSSWLFQIEGNEILQRLAIPTLIMQGSQDSIAKEGDIIDILVRIKNPFIVYETFPQSGHEIIQDVPQSFVERVQRFLKEEYICA